MMDVSMSIQEIRRSVLEDIRAREIYIPETGFLAGPTYPVREMVETGIWRQQDYGWDNLHFPLNYKLLMQGRSRDHSARKRAPRWIERGATRIPRTDCGELE